MTLELDAMRDEFERRWLQAKPDVAQLSIAPNTTGVIQLGGATMTGLVRKAILLSAVGVLVAGAAMAGVPNAGNSTKPNFIIATGYTNPPDPVGNVTYIIRDINNLVVPNAEIVLDFTQCTDTKLSQNINGNGGVTTCASKRITGTTDGLGVLTLSAVAGGNGSGFAAINLPRATNACVQVTVNSTPFPAISVATADRDGASGVASGDLSALIFDFVNFPAAGRSDLDNSGAVASGDLSALISIFVAGGSALSGSPYCP